MGEEVPLAPDHYPPLPDHLGRAERRQWLADARRVIWHPKFNAGAAVDSGSAR
jgi:hypothetical protein